MEKYKNLSADSGVTAFQIGKNFIQVEFGREHKIYLYTYESAGQANIERMKRLARRGRGLATFISQVVRNKFKAQLN